MTLISETWTTLQELHSGDSSLQVQIVKIISLPFIPANQGWEVNPPYYPHKKVVTGKGKRP